MKDAIVAAARAHGADAIRFAPAAPLAETRERMRASFARGDLATWTFDDAYAQRASDASHVLDGAQTVICIAVVYATPAPKRPRGSGRVSNYAWSADYHRRMRATLGAIAAEIDALAGGACTAIACDTAPIAERAYAERAGLGWIGKHTNLIAPGLGSYVFLGEIVTTLALEPDAPSKKQCGSCTRCISACPTGALRGDGTIDATRCISDLTQRTDAIPAHLRVHVGEWVWGCDLCQEACPPTQRAPFAADPAFTPLDPATAAPPLQALLALRSGTFKRRYARSAMGWRGGAVLRRNAAVALGNGLDRADVPALATALNSDANPSVRAHTAWALGRIGSPFALHTLEERLPLETDATVRSELLAARETIRSGVTLNVEEATL